jgi:dTDP-4-dehydrorhamnose reductase
VIGGIYKYLGEGMKVLYGPELTTNTVHVKDVCRAIWHVCTTDSKGVYHVVDDNNTTQESINHLILDIFGVKYEYLGAALSTFAKVVRPLLIHRSY